MLIGTLARIRRYPVKSLAGETLERTEVSASGIPGDRAGALFVRGGHARAGKTYRGKEHDELHLLRDPDRARALAAARGIDVELRSDGRFFDDAPISLLIDRWVDGLSASLGRSVEPERFRANFFVRAAPAYAENEEDLSGADLRLGDVRLRVRGPIARCVVVTYDPAGGPSDPRVLADLARRRNACIGVYCDVLAPGTAGVGDVLLRL